MRRLQYCLISTLLIASAAPGAWAQENAIAGASDGVTERSLGKFIDTLTQGALKYYKLYEQLNGELSKGSEPLLKGLKIAGGTPVVFDEAVLDALNAEKARYAQLAKSLAPPLLADPVTEKLKASLDSPDPKLRKEAFEQIDSSLKDYEDTIHHFEEKRAQAARISQQADAAYDRLQIVEQKLSEINRSPAGVILNAATDNHFAWLWLDANTTVFDAVAGRAAAARDLLGAYDEKIRKMKAALAAYDDVRAWVRFYKLQEALRISTGNKHADALLEHAKQGEELAKHDAELAANISVPSGPSRELHDTAVQVGRQVDDTSARVKQLWEQARDEDDAAERQRKTMILISMATGAANIAKAAVGSGSAVPSTTSSSASATPVEAIHYEYTSPTYHYSYQFTIYQPPASFGSARGASTTPSK